jgi:ankyrin repeat protein
MEDSAFIACEEGDLESVEVFLRNGRSVNELFQFASKNGHIEAVKFLVEKGADIHLENGYAIRWASLQGHVEVVKFLVEKGANLVVYGKKTIRWACINGQVDLVNYLIQKGVSIDNQLGDELLRLACHHGHFKIVQCLFNEGIDVRGPWPILLASTSRNFEIAKFLFEKGAKKSLLSRRTKKYLDICERTRIRAANKIGSWWIPICYDVNRECGKRMMERSWERVEKMYEERN